MCGIVGANRLPTVSITSLLELIKHRGPDHQAYYTYQDVFLGHSRLAIIDTHSEAANQPMRKQGVVIVFNGEIYNYKELIKAENLECETESDTEVIILLYLKYGEIFLNKLDGMFSFCIYDEQKNTFFCARDRFGKKPFYYYRHEDIFIFASELKGIIAQLPSLPQMNILAVQQYFAFQAPIHDQTFFQNIYKLPSGHALIVKNGGVEVFCYYDINAVNFHSDTEDQAIQKVDAFLNQAVQDRLVGDEEVAVLLSGGLDSSLVAKVYAQYSDRKVNTFSIGYDEHRHYCELSFAQEAAKEIGSNHHELRVGYREYLEGFEGILNFLDEPMADSASIPLYLLSEFIHKQGIKVSLSGEGSDENFLGYDNYFKMLDAYKSIPEDPGEFNLTKQWSDKNRRFNNEEIFFSSGETYTYEQRRSLFSGEIEKVISSFQSPYVSKERWLTYIDFKIWIPEVLMSKVDRMSMAHSLELRAPFLDHRLVEYMLGLDDKIKRGVTNKAILKQVALKYLSPSIVHRQKKGFSSPFIEWLYRHYKDEILHQIERVNNELGLFVGDFVEFLYEEGKERRFKQHVYSLFLFARWYEKVYM